MLDVLYYPVSAVMWFWYRVFGLALGPASGVAWGLSVVFLVLTLRALMIKPFLAQTRVGHRMQAIAPQLAELRKRHSADKQKLLEETQKLQRAHRVNPLGGCLPLLIQMPVFLALLHVLRYFNRPDLSFEQNAAIPNYVFGPDEVRSFLQARLFGAPLSSYLTMPQSLLDSFGAHVQRWEVVVVAVPLMLLAAVATHVAARFSLRQQRQVGRVGLEASSQAARIASFMRLTPWIFPLGVIVGGLCFPFPIAILLYWLTTSSWTVAQQHLVYRAIATEAAQAAGAQAQLRAEAAPRPGQKPAPRPWAKPLVSGAPVAGADHEPTDPATPRAGGAQRGRKATANHKRAGIRKGRRR